ncbi:hypothetical protein BD289DRAFT_274778 [Coniella lustricola]|uniref:Uncharacterized protein n=1 Tax=Coniella lustricola TaxID=2025994 RepID=A0A2T3A6Q7_9PEZI|nr:hypothetical protein BD289DRAFT_274778 [Coniella lustricola]
MIADLLAWPVCAANKRASQPVFIVSYRTVASSHAPAAPVAENRLDLDNRGIGGNRNPCGWLSAQPIATELGSQIKRGDLSLDWLVYQTTNVAPGATGRHVLTWSCYHSLGQKSCLAVLLEAAASRRSMLSGAVHPMALTRFQSLLINHRQQQRVAVAQRHAMLTKGPTRTSGRLFLAASSCLGCHCTPPPSEPAH